MFEPKNVTDDVSMVTSNHGQNVHQNDVPNDVPLNKNSHATISVKTDTETEKTIETQSAHSSHMGSNTHIDLAEQDGVDHSANSVKKQTPNRRKTHHRKGMIVVGESMERMNMKVTVFIGEKRIKGCRKTTCAPILYAIGNIRV